MRKCIFLIILLLYSSCYGKIGNRSEGEEEMDNFYKNYNIYKIKKMIELGKNEEPEIIDDVKDKCIINYLSKEIKNKKKDYQEYLLSLPVNDTDKYDKLIIDLTIKSAGPLRENWNFMHHYLNDLKDIDRIFERLNNYDSNDIYSFFSVYFKGYEAPYPNINGEATYFEEELKKINMIN